MKKILFTIILTVFILSSVLCPITSALDLRYPEGSWVMTDDLQLLYTGDGRQYARFDGTRSFQLDEDLYDECEYIDVVFECLESESAKEKYAGTLVTVYGKLSAIAVEVDIYSDGRYEQSVWYVLKEKADEFEQLKLGKGINFSTKNNYLNSFYNINLGTYSNWKESSTVINFPASKIPAPASDRYSFYVSDSSGMLNYEAGIILRIAGESGNNEYYLLEYADYDRTYFFADGTLAEDHDGMLSAYKLENEILAAELTAFYDEMPSDELDWVVGEDKSDVLTLVFSTVFFGIIPLAVILFSIIMLVKSRKVGYRRAAYLMLSGAGVVILSFLIILLLILK